MLIVNFSKMEFTDKKYHKQFLDMLLKEIQDEVWKHLNITELNKKAKLLLDVSWISWIKKPKLVNGRRVVSLILHSLQWVPISSSAYKLRINPRKRFPWSTTPLSTIARWLEYGDEGTSKPMFFLMHAQSVIRPNLRRYWRAFIQAKEGAVKIHERIYVR